MSRYRIMPVLFLCCLLVASTVNGKYNPPKVEQQVEQTSIDSAPAPQTEAALLSVTKSNVQNQVSSFQTQSGQSIAIPSAASVFAQLEQKYPHLKFNNFQGGSSSGSAHHSGPINVAINQVSRTVEFRPEAVRVTPVKPSFLEVGPNTNSLNLLFKSKSNSLFNTFSQQPSAGRPDTSVYFSSSVEPPLQLVQTVHKPIVREYSQYLPSVRYSTSVRPVQETVETIVHTSQQGGQEGRQRQAQSQTSSQAQFQTAFQQQASQSSPVQAQTFFQGANKPIFSAKVNGKSAFEHAREILGTNNQLVSGSQGYSQVQVASKPLVFNTPSGQSSYSYSSASSSSSGQSSFSPSIQNVISKFNSFQVKPSVAHVIQTTRPLTTPVSQLELEVTRNPSVSQTVTQQVQQLTVPSVQTSQVHQQEVQRLQVPVHTTFLNQFDKLTVPVITRRVENFSPLPFAIPQFNYQPQVQFQVPFAQPQYVQPSSFVQQQIVPQSVQSIQTEQQYVPTFQTVRTVQVRPLVQETTFVHAKPHSVSQHERQIFQQAQSVRPVSVAKFVETPTVIGTFQTQPQNIQSLSQNQNSYLLRDAQQQQQQVQQVQPQSVQSVQVESRPVTSVTFESAVPTVNFQAVQPQTTVNRQVKYSTTEESSEESSESSSSSQSVGAYQPPIPAPLPIATVIPAPLQIPTYIPAPSTVVTEVSGNSVESNQESVDNSGGSQSQSSVEYAQPEVAPQPEIAPQPVAPAPVASSNTNSAESSSTDISSEENESSSSTHLSGYNAGGSSLVQQPALQLDQTQQHYVQEDEVDSSKKKRSTAA